MITSLHPRGSLELAGSLRSTTPNVIAVFRMEASTNITYKSPPPSRGSENKTLAACTKSHDQTHGTSSYCRAPYFPRWPCCQPSPVNSLLNVLSFLLYSLQRRIFETHISTTASRSRRLSVRVHSWHRFHCVMHTRVCVYGESAAHAVWPENAPTLGRVGAKYQNGNVSRRTYLANLPRNCHPPQQSALLVKCTCKVARPSTVRQFIDGGQSFRSVHHCVHFQGYAAAYFRR